MAVPRWQLPRAMLVVAQNPAHGDALRFDLRPVIPIPRRNEPQAPEIRG
jgi:hypothetical protein